MAPTEYKVLGERAAEVDDVRLEPGGDPHELSQEQVERLATIGVAVEAVDADGDERPLSKLKKSEAIARANALGLDTSGTLDDLVERIEAHEAVTADQTGGES